jgi:GH43 family beta-xylosidase
MSSRNDPSLLVLVALATGCSHVTTTAIDGGDVAADVSATAPDTTAPRGTFRNPLDSGPDPFLRYYAGHYYLMTTQGDALRMKRAVSLAELAVAEPITIWQDSDPSRNQHMWAPAFYPLDGRWYVYYTADDGIDDHHRLYVIESAAGDPLGPYHFKAKLEPPGATGLFAIDPEVLEHGAGRYLVWSGAGSEGHNTLHIAPLHTR